MTWLYRHRWTLAIVGTALTINVAFWSLLVWLLLEALS